MKFEDLKKDFPKMPEEMRTMIEKEVEKQVKTEQMPFATGRNAVRHDRVCRSPHVPYAA